MPTSVGSAVISTDLAESRQLSPAPYRPSNLTLADAIYSLPDGVVFHTLVDAAEQQRALLTVRAQLGEETFTSCWSQGQALTGEQAIAYTLTTLRTIEAALAVQKAARPSAPSPAQVAGLTTREVEVLQLLTQRLAYTQIAEKLIISQRTVNAHITSIYSKLGVTTREAAIRFAAEQHLLASLDK